LSKSLKRGNSEAELKEWEARQEEAVDKAASSRNQTKNKF
jgi:hypothetical protein